MAGDERGLRQSPAGLSDRSPRIALVHDWVVDLGGAERVLATLREAFPAADLFTLFYREASLRHLGFDPRATHATFLQGLPGIERRYRSLLPLFPLAIQQLNLTGYDLIVSSSHCVAKGVRLRPGQVHFCYCHTPMRYAWHMESDYLRLHGWSGGVRGAAARAILARLRAWDRTTARGVDKFLANSHVTAERIQRFYGREAEVLHPPIDLDRFSLQKHKEDFFLFLSRLVPYKRADLAVQAFTRLGLRLLVVGDGPEAEACRRLAGPTVEFLGRADDAPVADLLARARALVFTADEDFGIVPVEAQACGTPVIAYGSGGVLDSVVAADGTRWNAATGVLYAEQSLESLEDGVRRFLASEDRFEASVLRRNAERFSRDRFIAGIQRSTEPWARLPEAVTTGPRSQAAL